MSNRRPSAPRSAMPLRTLALCGGGLMLGAAGVLALDSLSELDGEWIQSRVLSTLPPQPLPATRPSVAPQRQGAISQAQMLYLVRAALLRLNDANRSGNYSVLRGQAAPSFIARNSDADLVRIFAGVRQAGTDLSAVALLAPALDQPPLVGPDRRLRIKGVFELPARQVRFDLAWEIVAGEWRLFAISIGLGPLRLAQVRG